MNKQYEIRNHSSELIYGDWNELKCALLKHTPFVLDYILFRHIKVNMRLLCGQAHFKWFITKLWLHFAAWSEWNPPANIISMIYVNKLWTDDSDCSVKSEERLGNLLHEHGESLGVCVCVRNYKGNAEQKEQPICSHSQNTVWDRCISLTIETRTASRTISNARQMNEHKSDSYTLKLC